MTSMCQIRPQNQRYHNHCIFWSACISGKVALIRRYWKSLLDKVTFNSSKTYRSLLRKQLRFLMSLESLENGTKIGEKLSQLLNFIQLSNIQITAGTVRTQNCLVKMQSVQSISTRFAFEQPNLCVIVGRTHMRNGKIRAIDRISPYLGIIRRRFWSKASPSVSLNVPATAHRLWVIPFFAHSAVLNSHVIQVFFKIFCCCCIRNVSRNGHLLDRRHTNNSILNMQVRRNLVFSSVNFNELWGRLLETYILKLLFFSVTGSVTATIEKTVMTKTGCTQLSCLPRVRRKKTSVSRIGREFRSALLPAGRKYADFGAFQQNARLLSPTDYRNFLWNLVIDFVNLVLCTCNSAKVTLSHGTRTVCTSKSKIFNVFKVNDVLVNMGTTQQSTQRFAKLNFQLFIKSWKQMRYILLRCHLLMALYWWKISKMCPSISFVNRDVSNSPQIFQISSDCYRKIK